MGSRRPAMVRLIRSADVDDGGCSGIVRSPLTAAPRTSLAEVPMEVVYKRGQWSLALQPGVGSEGIVESNPAG